VPFPRAASSRLISFFTFHISIYFCTPRQSAVASRGASAIQAGVLRPGANGAKKGQQTHVFLGLVAVKVAHGGRVWLNETRKREKRKRMSRGRKSFLGEENWTTTIKLDSGLRGFKTPKSWQLSSQNWWWGWSLGRGFAV
jgi:hypothetical protein